MEGEGLVKRSKVGGRGRGKEIAEGEVWGIKKGMKWIFLSNYTQPLSLKIIINIYTKFDPLTSEQSLDNSDKLTLTFQQIKYHLGLNS